MICLHKGGYKLANIVSLVNQKGGVGKTTTTHNLGYALARDEEEKSAQKTLIVDLDPQMNLSDTLGIDCYAQNKSIHDVLVSKELPLGRVVQNTNNENLDIIPSDFELSGAEVEFTKKINPNALLRRSITKSMEENYDFILIDCPPALGTLTINALTASDYVIIPMQPETYALYGIDLLVTTVEEVQEEINSKLQIMGVLITMHDGRLNVHKEMTEQIQKYFKGNVMNTIIKTNTKLKEAQNNHASIFEYDGRARGAKNYEKLAREVVLKCQEKQ